MVNERVAPRRSARESVVANETTSVRSSTSNLSPNDVVDGVGGFDADIGGVGGGSDVADTIFLCILLQLLAEENAVTLVAPPPPPQMNTARNSKKEMDIMVNGQK